MPVCHAGHLAEERTVCQAVIEVANLSVEYVRVGILTLEVEGKVGVIIAGTGGIV